MNISKKLLAFGVGAVIATGAVAMQIPDSSMMMADTAASAATPAVALPRSIALKVSLSAKELYVIEDGEVTKTYPVTVGTSAHPTPRGGFSMKRIIWNPRWVPPEEKWAKGKTAKGPGEKGNPMGKVKVFFNEPDYYIHGTLAVNELGTAASHGCIRLTGDAMRWLTARIGPGDPVTIRS